MSVVLLLLISESSLVSGLDGAGAMLLVSTWWRSGFGYGVSEFVQIRYFWSGESVVLCMSVYDW
jgi:hypothetical protein